MNEIRHYLVKRLTPVGLWILVALVSPAQAREDGAAVQQFTGIFELRQPSQELQIGAYDYYLERGEDYSTKAGQAAYLERQRNTIPYRREVDRSGLQKAEAQILKKLPTSGGSYQLEARLGEKKVSKILADLDQQGDLSFSIETQSEGQRGPIAGRVLFDRMMAFFGDQVKSISGIWVYETNLELFQGAVNLLTSEFEASKKVLPSEDELDLIYKAAALRTWTGQQAVRHGFSQVVDVDVEFEDGKIDEATARFQKPYPLGL